MFTRLDVVLPFTLRMLFILDLLIYITIYIFIIADTFLISFTCITLWDSRHFCSHNIQFPTWQNQPDTGKMAELKVDNESQAQRGQVGSRTRIHTTGQWHHHSSWTSKSGPGQDWIFYIYICQEINTCCIFHFLTEGSLVILLYSCLAAAFLLSTSGAVNIGAWSLHGGGGDYPVCVHEWAWEIIEGRAAVKQVCMLTPKQKTSQGASAPTNRDGCVATAWEPVQEMYDGSALPWERTSYKTRFKYRLRYSMF